MSYRSYVLAVTWAVTASASVDALNISAHRLINVSATGKDTADDYSSAFDRYLREFLGLVNGRETILRVGVRQLIAEQWLAEGGEREDDGLPFSGKARVYRHFHNPLRPWDAAGLLTRYPFRLEPHQYTSSVRWMQADDQAADDGGAAGGTWAWRDARRLQYLVLTTDDARQREAYAADLFRALGQIMHLVVDASVPEHVRNDPHPLGTFTREVLRSRTAGNYEYWVSAEQARLGDAGFTARYLSVPIAPAAGVPGLAPPHGEAVATRPVARLIDADRYLAEAPDPEVTLSDPIGIAEFANANFFSEDTLFGGDTQGQPLPFPRRDALVRRVDRAPSRSGNRTYLEKRAGQGLVTRFALAECRLEGRGAALPPYPCVDEAVWEETATHMLPRAVGYAREVLDHFFRGSLRVHGVSISDPVPGFAIPGVTGIWIDIENTSSEPMEGVFEVFGRGGKGTEQERRTRVATVNDGAPVVLDPGAAGRFRLSLSFGDPTAYQLLVFRGRLGSEENAVAGQVFTVPHVHVSQRSYQADISKTCQTFRFFTAEWLVEERLNCLWRALNQRVEGALATNFGNRSVADPMEPAIEKIRAFWTGDASGPAPLVIDEVKHTDGVWQRRGDEPDPTMFVIADAAARGRSVLWVSVSIRGHVAQFTIPLATFGDQSTRTFKKVLHLGVSHLVYAQRPFTITLNAPLTHYSVISIGGYPVPTSIMREQLHAKPDIWRESIDVTPGRGNQTVTSFFEIVPGASGEATWEPPLKGFTLEAPFPHSPDLHWTAELLRKPLDALTREFWQTFVAADDPPADAIVLTGREAAP